MNPREVAQSPSVAQRGTRGARGARAAVLVPVLVRDCTIVEVEDGHGRRLVAVPSRDLELAPACYRAPRLKGCE